MRAHTTSALLPIPAVEAFHFLSRLDNVPRWATEFVTGGFELEGDHAVAKTAKGRVIMRLRTDEDTLVIDHIVEPAPGVEAVFPGRIVPLPDGRSLFLFTAVQAPDQSDADFDRDMASLDRELRGLPEVIDG